MRSKARGNAVEDAERHVDDAFVQRGEQIIGEGHDADRDHRRDSAHGSDQAWRHEAAEIRAGTDREFALRAVGIEPCGCERIPQLLEAGTDVARHRVGARSGLKCATGPQEQRIADGAAQPSQRVTDRGLRQSQAPCGSRHAALIVERIENRQQVEIELRHERCSYHTHQKIIRSIAHPYYIASAAGRRRARVDPARGKDKAWRTRMK